MAEQLGEALLVLRTDDRGLDAGITNAKGKSEGLGRTLDATSGSASKLSKALDDTGSSASSAGSKTAEYSREVSRLKAQIDPAWGALQKFRGEAQLARQALDAGAISHKQYVDAMRQSATSAGLLNNAGKQVVAVTGAQRAGLQQLTMNLGDMSTMYSMGARPMQIFASQSSQIVQAVQLMTGGTSRFAAFMGGPWGMGITAGAMILLPLISNLFGAEDAAKKTGDANETLAQKLDRSKHSIVEVIAALRDYNGEQAKARETTLQQAEAATKSADAELKKALATRTKLAAELEARRASATGNAGQGTGGAAGAYTQGQLTATEQRIKDNEARIADLRKQASEANINLADQRSDINADPTKAIRERFAALKQGANDTIKDVDKLTARLTALKLQEEAALKTARESARGSGSSASADASVGDMTALLKDIFPGVRITSTTGGKHGAKSDHYKGRGIDFVPQGGMGTYTTAEVEKILEDAGVTIRRNASGTKQIFGPGRSADKPGDHNDHFHVAWEGGASPEEAERRKAQAAERAARAKEKEDQRVERYSRDLAGLQQAAADIQKRMGDTAEERYRLELQGLEIATAEHKRRIEANREYTQAEKAKLLAALAVKDSLERQLLEHRRQEELSRQALEVAQAQWSNERELLEKQASLTDVRTERRAIEQKILDEQYKQLRAELEWTAQYSKDDGARVAAKDRLAKLPELKALDQQRLNRDTESPLERYRREVQGVGNNINDELEGVAVNGLEKLSDGLGDVIMNAKSLGDVFKDVAKQIIAQLVQIAVQQVLIKPLLEALGGSGGGGGLSIGGGSGGGGLGGLFSSLGNLFAGMFADGGLIPNGSFGIVGEAGPEPIFATSGGIGVLPNSALRAAGGSEKSGPSYLHVSVSGARGNAEIEAMVTSGVRQGLASYDSVVGDRVKDHIARRR
ncbi:hypothetical protein [Sphingomonas sp. ERG5]|uniref:hypothetical protein n=1 Tax=Sphingomonas sp. ERG5 TaxID=1381597 RepID=UPI00054C24B3|nr:hypothetical protein [Sphingomonas sp. ERG5]